MILAYALLIDRMLKNIKEIIIKDYINKDIQKQNKPSRNYLIKYKDFRILKILVSTKTRISISNQFLKKTMSSNNKNI